MYKFIDLFCGIGGFRLALEKRGLECVFSSDIDINAQKAYKKNFGDVPKGDITEIPSNMIPKHDILCAGFPCQSFSISGKQRGILDPRGQLFFEIERIASYHKPYLLLLENVKNLAVISNGKALKIIRESLNNIGYDMYNYLLNASHFGIPQSRERIYFVGIRKDIKDSSKPMLKTIAPKKTYKSVFLENILEKRVDNDFLIKRDDIRITKSENDIEYRLEPIRVGIVNKGGQGERIYSPKGHAITQSAFGGGVGAKTGLYNTPQGVRKLTINECKQVMGFPIKHYVSEGIQGYRQLGNAVIPDMIGIVYDNIKVL